MGERMTALQQEHKEHAFTFSYLLLSSAGLVGVANTISGYTNSLTTTPSAR